MYLKMSSAQRPLFSVGTSVPSWGRMTHICVGKLIIIVSDNGLSPGRRQAIIWTNAGIWLMGPLGTNFSEILIEIHTFSFKKMYLKMSSAKWRLFCLGLNVLMTAVPRGVLSPRYEAIKLCVRCCMSRRHALTDIWGQTRTLNLPQHLLWENLITSYVTIRNRITFFNWVKPISPI